MRLRPALRAGVAVVLFALCANRPANAVDFVDDDFESENAVPGVTFEQPTGIAFLPDGRMLVAEKRGRVWVVQNGVRLGTEMWQRESEVLNEHDRGLLGIAVDPNYATNRFIYLLYTVDPDSNGNDSNASAFGRLTRYQVSAGNPNVVDASTRTVLMGHNWPNGPASASPSHTIGSLRWGTDGSLIVSTGDGASFTTTDAGGLHSSQFTAGRTATIEDIGAFRSQYLGSLAGKILRLNPTNGHGYPSNPFWNGTPNSVQSRIWAYGVRNPFRITVRPGTGSTDPAAGDPGTVYVGDVGWSTWEDIHPVRQGGVNCGWPCFEGMGPHGSYQGATPAHSGCGTLPNPSPHTPPIATWHHSTSGSTVPPGFIGNATSGAAFYTATKFPVEYRNRLFTADYGQNWIKVMEVDANDNLVGVAPFATNAEGPVDIALNPVNNELYYVSINSGEVRRIFYTQTVGNAPPVAVGNASPSFGVAPLTVEFSSEGTHDPDNDPITIGWSFGDGNGTSDPNPSHVYAAAGTYRPILTVTDTTGAVTHDTLTVTVVLTATFPTTGVLDNFNRANGALAAPWIGNIGGMAVNSNTLVCTTADAWPLWGGATFGPLQEVYISMTAEAPASNEFMLMLKIQGNSYFDGFVGLQYNETEGRMMVVTYHPTQGQVVHSGVIPFSVNPGDQFGGRAHPDGTIEVVKNGQVVATQSVAAWPFHANGGRIGMSVVFPQQGRWDNFGGGDVVVNVNDPPVATFEQPADGGFYVEQTPVFMQGSATDPEDPPASLAREFRVVLHHNTHTHLSGVFAGDTATIVPENHEDGTGTWLELLYVATDTGALKDTARVVLWPQTDVTPSAVSTAPISPGTTAPAQYRFWIRNLGGMPTRTFHWTLRGGATLLAQGDTVVAAHDSVEVVRTVAPLLAAGPHTLRVKVDTLAVMTETNENNNAATRALTVLTGPGSDDFPPVFTVGPTATPGTTTANVSWTTDERTTGVVRYGTTPALGDSVTSPIGFAHSVGFTGLFSGTLYHYRVVARDSSGNAATSAPATFTTSTPNTPPTAAIAAPEAGAFYATGDVLLLDADASDFQDPPALLDYQWSVLLEMPPGNVTASSIAAEGDTASVVLAGYGGGPGEKLHVRLIVTDTQGAKDTAEVVIFPEVDLRVSSLRTIPSSPGTTAPANYRFTIHNLGRMPAPVSRWRLVADGTLLAEGDTTVAPLDSVIVSRTLAPVLVAGSHLLRAAADTLEAITEVLETNNAETHKIDVVEGPGPDEFGPVFLAGPSTETIGSTAHVTWQTDERSTGIARFGITTALWDTVETPAGFTHHAAIGGLDAGTRYYLSVMAADSLGNFNEAPLDSFTTPGAQTSVGPSAAIRLSPPRPNPTTGRTAMAIDLPSVARVRFSVHDVQGREVWSEHERVLEAGRWSLVWPGTDAGGSALRAGIYLARVQVGGESYVHRFALLR